MNRTNNLSVLTAVFTLLILTLSLFFNANADMGRIYVSNEAVKVSEDAQKAIIVHNLEEEVLILGTDLKADKKIGIIRFIPFPSEPKVSLAPDNAFEKASAMIKKYGLKYQYVSRSKGGSASTTTEGVEFRFNKKLGSHDISVIKVNDVSTFRQWVNDFFKSKGLPLKETYPEEEAIVDDYVKRGIIYFVLDFVEVLQETRFIEPVMYKFKSKELYYPLKTSNTFGGEGSIELIIIAPTTLFARLPFDSSGVLFTKYVLNLPVDPSTSALIVKEDIKEIYPEGESFFKDQKAFIQVIRYQGKYYFKEDIFVDVSKGLPSASAKEAAMVYTGNGYFTVKIPAGWNKAEVAFGLSQEEKKVYGAEFLGPEDADGIFSKISVRYYAPGNMLHKTAEKFIATHSRPVLGAALGGRKYGPVEDGLVGKYYAKVFERETFEFVPPEAISPKKIPVYEKFHVIPVKNGFYVLSYYSSMAAAKTGLAEYESVLASFVSNEAVR